MIRKFKKPKTVIIIIFWAHEQPYEKVGRKSKVKKSVYLKLTQMTELLKSGKY